jgi:hypothetical protein
MLDSFFLSVPSFHPHQDEGWRSRPTGFRKHGGFPEKGMWLRKSGKSSGSRQASGT